MHVSVKRAVLEACTIGPAVTRKLGLLIQLRSRNRQDVRVIHQAAIQAQDEFLLLLFFEGDDVGDLLDVGFRLLIQAWITRIVQDEFKIRLRWIVLLALVLQNAGVESGTGTQVFIC